MAGGNANVWVVHPVPDGIFPISISLSELYTSPRILMSAMFAPVQTSIVMPTDDKPSVLNLGNMSLPSISSISAVPTMQTPDSFWNIS